MKEFFRRVRNKIGLTYSFLNRKKRKNFSIIQFIRFVFEKEIRKPNA